jgi:hypothetical protein
MGHAVAAYGVAVRDAGEPDDDATLPDGGVAPLYGVFVDAGPHEPDGGAVAAYGVFVDAGH